MAASAFEVVIIGGGIVGLATAYRLMMAVPQARLTLLEKESELARHQSWRNSGVVHSGIYYPPGTTKATTCLQGREALVSFCEAEGLPLQRREKLIVAVTAGEAARLGELYESGRANGVACELISSARVHELEPEVRALRAIRVRETAITDYRAIALRLAEKLRGGGHRVVTGAEVVDLQERERQVVVRSRRGDFRAAYVINCAGLYADRLAAMVAGGPGATVVPFRGEYYRLKEGCSPLKRMLVYPVPDARFPFLGVHFTPTLSGQLLCGPNAVLALSRQGYSWSRVDLGELARMLIYPGFVRLALRYWKQGLAEMWRSLSKRAFVATLQEMVPCVSAEDLEPAMTGVRAQAVGRDGRLLDDFFFHETKRGVHVLNAPSPGATASLAIGQVIVDRLSARWT